MKKKKYLCLNIFPFLLILFALKTSAEGNGPVKSRVREVCVFTSGARITSEGELQLQKGTQEIMIEGISAFADENSLTFRCNSEFSLLSIRLQAADKAENAPGSEARVIEDSIRITSIRLNRIQHQQSALQEELNMLKANHKITGSGTSHTSELEKAASFFRSRTEDILNRQYDAEQLKIKLQERLNLLQEKQQRIAAGSTSGRLTAVVLLKSAQAGKAAFQIGYTCGNAGWTPLYDIQATGSSDKIGFLARASVWQTTGLNWNEVKMSLSTGNPAAGQQIPEIFPHYLSIHSPQPKARQAYLQGRAMAAPSMPLAKAEASVADMEFQAAAAPESRVSEGGTQNTYELSNSYSLRSDGKPVSVDIQKFDVPAGFRYICRPGMEKAAFLEARLKDWGRSGLLPGEASLYLDGNFSGKTMFETASADDTLSLSFGKDQNISVERKQFRYLQDKNLTGSEKTLEVGYELLVKNRKSSPSRLTIEDQIPLSPNASAEVELLESSNGSLEKETGVLRWNLNLKGGESSTLRFRFKVKYPRNMVLDTRF